MSPSLVYDVFQYRYWIPFHFGISIACFLIKNNFSCAVSYSLQSNRYSDLLSSCFSLAFTLPFATCTLYNNMWIKRLFKNYWDNAIPFVWKFNQRLIKDFLWKIFTYIWVMDNLPRSMVNHWYQWGASNKTWIETLWCKNSSPYLFTMPQYKICTKGWNLS